MSEAESGPLVSRHRFWRSEELLPTSVSTDEDEDVIEFSRQVSLLSGIILMRGQYKTILSRSVSDVAAYQRCKNSSTTRPGGSQLHDNGKAPKTMSLNRKVSKVVFYFAKLR